jgi:hypothetical protein
MKKKQRLIIGVEQDIVFIELYDSVNKTDRNEWQNDGGSSEKLLEKVNIFLLKNKLKVTDLSVVKTQIDEKQKYTLARIIKTVANTINYCLKKE